MARIRRARADDRPGILAAHVAAIRVTCRTHYADADIEAWAGRRTEESYDESLAGRDALVAEHDGRILGFGVLDAEAAELVALYVHPDAGRRGLGGRLLAALETVARLRGLVELRLDSSLNAIAFYAAAGWRDVGACRRTFPGGRDIACRAMAKRLPALRLQLRAAASDDAAAIEALAHEAFAPGASAPERRRRDGACMLSLVACLDGVVVGHVALSAAALDGVAGRGAVLEPIAVAPALRGCAIGARLVEEALARARAVDVCAVVVAGDHGYYARFGFVPARDVGLAAADVMVAELARGALPRASGTAR